MSITIQEKQQSRPDPVRSYGETMLSYFLGGTRKFAGKGDAKLIKSSVGSALWRLANMPDCKKFIQEEFDIDPTKILEDVYKNGKIYRKALKNAVAQALPGAGSKGYIELDNSWFDDPTIQGWVGTLNRTNLRTLAILHELKHLVGTDHPGPLLLSMGVRNRDNNYFYRGIVRTCFGLNIPEPAKEPVWPKSNQ